MQAYYLASPFPIERAPTKPLERWNHPGSEILVSRLDEYPVRGMAFETSSDLEGVAHLLGRWAKPWADAQQCASIC